MAGTTETWDGEHILLLLKKTSPEKRQKLLDEFNQSVGFHTQSVREWKHASGLHCPNCGPEQKSDIVHNGRMTPGSNRQRYFCRTCGASFNDHTGTVFHRSKKSRSLACFSQSDARRQDHTPMCPRSRNQSGNCPCMAQKNIVPLHQSSRFPTFGDRGVCGANRQTLKQRAKKRPIPSS